MRTPLRIVLLAVVASAANGLFAQSAGSLVLAGIERITDTGIDGPGYWRFSANYRKYRREINLLGSIYGIASIPASNANGLTDYNSFLVDQSDTVYDRPQKVLGDYTNSRFNVEFVGFTSTAALRDVSGKLIIKESVYESQRVANPAVAIVFPRSAQTYPINGEPYVILTPTPNPPGSSKWANLSTRVFAGTGASALTVGFVITGTVPKNYLVRVAGPSLAQFGIAGFLPDPAFQVIPLGGTNPVAQNDDWGGSQALAAAMSSVGAFPFTGPASKDSASIVTLAPGGYSVVVNTSAGNTGIALVEVYEIP